MLSTSSNIVSDFQRIWSQPAKETIYNVPFQRNSSNRFHLRNCKLRVWNLGWNWSSDAVTQSTRPLRCYSPWPITNSRRTAQESITLLTFFLPQNYYVIDNLTSYHILWTTTFTSTHWTTFFGEFYSVSFFSIFAYLFFRKFFRTPSYLFTIFVTSVEKRRFWLFMTSWVKEVNIDRWKIHLNICLPIICKINYFFDLSHFRILVEWQRQLDQHGSRRVVAIWKVKFFHETAFFQYLI